MYVRVSPGHFSVARYDDVVRMTQERLVPALYHLPGFRGFQGCVDRQAGKLLAISLWDTEDQARALRDTIGDIIAQYQAIGAEFESPEIYELAVQA